MILDGDKLVEHINMMRLNAAGLMSGMEEGGNRARLSGADKALALILKEILAFEIKLEGPSLHNVHTTDPEGAQEAAGSNTFGRSKNRAKVYEAVKALGSGTPEEIATKAIELYPGVYPPYSLARRVTDLAERGVIQKTGEKRRTTAGGMADVWELIP